MISGTTGTCIKRTVRLMLQLKYSLKYGYSSVLQSRNC